MLSFFDQWKLNDDAPISLTTQDTFDRRHMARRMAHLLSQKPMSQPDSPETPLSSFTIAICGSWGEGKTSFKNLIQSRWDGDDKCPHVVDFNPRQWSSEAALIQAFFSELSNAVEEDKNKNAAEAAKTLRSIQDLLIQGQLFYTATAASVALFGADALHADKPLGAAALGLSFAASLFKRRAEIKEKNIDKQKNASFAELQANAHKQLLDLEKPVVVFVDDLDRLTGAEVALVFQLLKFNANFPNVVYILLADRLVLERGLDSLYPGEGRRYLEKFVQLSLDLPQATTDAVQNQFIEGFKPFFKELSSEYPDISNVIRASYEDILSPYLSTMRRVHLYLNALHFSLPLGKDPVTDAWEIYPWDVMLLELLRLHEPHLMCDSF